MLTHRNDKERSVRSRMQKKKNRESHHSSGLAVHVISLLFAAPHSYTPFPPPMLQMEGCSRNRELFDTYIPSFIWAHHCIAFNKTKKINFYEVFLHTASTGFTYRTTVSHKTPVKERAPGERGCLQPGLTL